MNTYDWLVLFATLAFIVIYGTVKTRGNKGVHDYLKGGNRAKWLTIGLSVMATQASAITFLSTPGQAFADGMGFVQFYFGLPIAMVIICLVFIPVYHRLKVYTAYEYLESRFNLKIRTLTAILFLVQRSLSAGITIFAPAIILSVVLGWNLTLMNLLIGILVIIYTVTGGTRAVNVTHKQQMAVILVGMSAVFFFLLHYLPDDVSFKNVWEIAGANDKLNILNFSLDFTNRYTIWSGLLGGTFLALSYFGTDQSQVQRYLSGKSVRESQMGMVFNGLLKVPMQFFILFVGVLVFVFYQFNPSPLNFNPIAQEAGQELSEYRDLQEKWDANSEEKSALTLAYVNETEGAAKKDLKEKIKVLDEESMALREEGKEQLTAKDKKVETNDRDYVFIYFILNNLPQGLIGLLLAVIFSAAMSSTASELNALASTTVIDLYKRNQKKERPEKHYVNASKWFTLMWGALAITVACTANLFDNLIQLVNIIGSIFYGNILGIFLLAFFVKYVKSKSVFIAAILTQIILILGWWFDWMPYLWLNLFGCMLVMGMAVGFQSFSKKKPVQKMSR